MFTLGSDTAWGVVTLKALKSAPILSFKSESRGSKFTCLPSLKLLGTGYCLDTELEHIGNFAHVHYQKIKYSNETIIQPNQAMITEV